MIPTRRNEKAAFVAPLHAIEFDHIAPMMMLGKSATFLSGALADEVRSSA